MLRWCPGWLPAGTALNKTAYRPGADRPWRFDCEGGYQAMHRLMQSPTRPTAVFACNDLMAMGAIRALQEQGLSVPHDISVIGYDNIAFAAYLNPPLTSISLKQELGQLAVQSLLERIQQPRCLLAPCAWSRIWCYAARPRQSNPSSQSIKAPCGALYPEKQLTA